MVKFYVYMYSQNKKTNYSFLDTDQKKYAKFEKNKNQEHQTLYINSINIML